MIATPSIQALIRDNKTFLITSDIQTGGRLGMFTLDAHLFELYQRGLISYEDLITKVQDQESVLEKVEALNPRKKR
jgi:twitching motility protein PilT